jgi:hypothetical protein
MKMRHYRRQSRIIRTMKLFLGTLLLGLGFLSEFRPAFADQPLSVFPSFRVETDLYEGDSTVPESQHLILFDSGVVYDLPIGTGSIISVFDVPRGRVILVHKGTKVRTSISTDTLVQMAAQVRAEAAKPGRRDIGLNAKVLPGTKPDSYVVEFRDNRYEATSQKVKDPTIAAEFASFTAWASRLNIARHVGSPPFARITLADHLAADNAIPRQVKLDVRLNFKTRTVRAEHLVVERLSELDREKIADAGGMVATFDEVSFGDFPTE